MSGPVNRAAGLERGLTTLALSLHQPWAWLVVYGGKDLENRCWNTNHRGRFLVHASKAMSLEGYEAAVEFARAADPSIVVPEPYSLERGGIVGMATIVGVVPPCLPSGYVGPVACRCGERWHIGEQYGFQLADVVPMPFRPVRGLQRWFHAPPGGSDGG